MIIKSSEFVKSAISQEQYPLPHYPEVAFSGRSNVGKSSLINVLLNRRRLVKTSSTPGRTQLINFFLVNSELSLVDLPGYGYAKVPVKVKKNWKPMLENYFTERKTIKVNILAMDVRRDPRKEEFNLIDWFKHHEVPLIIVLTKADKISKNKLLNRRRLIEAEFSSKMSHLILFSAKTKMGREEVWSAISYFLRRKTNGKKR